MTEGSATYRLHKEGMYKHTITYTNNDTPWVTADRLCRQNLTLLSLDVGKIFQYGAHCFDGFGLGHGHAVLVAADGSLHPSAVAFSNMAWLLENTKFKEVKTLAKGVYAYIFTGKGRSVAVISSKSEYEKITIPDLPEIIVYDLFGNPLDKGAHFDGKLIFLSSSKDIGKLLSANTKTMP